MKPKSVQVVYLICCLAAVVLGNKGSSTSTRETAIEGCAGFGTCCTGKNISCIGRGPSQSNKTSERCFCDEDCLQLADCCLDYRFICKSVNCLLSEHWTQWTECDRKCGAGTQLRTRQVLVQPRNGGKKCGDRTERRMCEKRSCSKETRSPNNGKGIPADQHAAVDQTANIVPAVFASWRMNALYNPLEGIRQSLFLHQLKYAALVEQKKPSYCATFKVTETRRACHRRIDFHQAKPSPPVAAPLQTKALTVGRTVCVECQPFGILQKTASDKCVGDGIFQMETKWNAVTAPGCHGKWIMTSEHQEPCHCDQSNETSFIFV